MLRGKPPLTGLVLLGNTIDLMLDISAKHYAAELKKVLGLEDVVNKYYPNAKGDEKLLLMEFVLHGMSEHSLLSKYMLEAGIQFKDVLGAVFSGKITDYDKEDDFKDEEFNN